jgi:hypothetical protein
VPLSYGRREKEEMKKVFMVIPIIVVVVVAAVLGAYFLFFQRAKPPGESSSTDTGTVVKYKTVSFVDSEGTGTKAFSMLIPVDWQSEGNIDWILDNPAMPVAGEFRAWNPDGNEEFDYFPNQAFFSSNNPMNVEMFPPGSRYFGALVHSPLGPVDALKEIALPLFRKDVEDMKVVDEKTLPPVGSFFETGTDPTTGVITSAEGGKIRVEYTLNGVAMEDEMYCIIQSQDIPVQVPFYGVTRNVNWYMTYLQSFRAEKGKLDSGAKVFQTISYFARTDVNWLNKYTQVVNYLIQQQIKQIESLGQLSRIVSETSNEISDANYDAWEQSQNVKDRLADDFSDSILNIQSYTNPIDGSTVDLPSGYSSAWTNSLGEYILSDSASYDPNTESNLNWQQLTTP